jgi:predicted phage terminase large subunit-like protein
MTAGTAEIQAEILPPQRTTTGQFQKGWKGGPGRQIGSRQKLETIFLERLYKHFKEEGDGAFQKALEADPVGYCRMIASLLPKEATRAELVKLSPGLRAAIIRDSLAAFAESCGFVPALHHLRIIEELEWLADTPNARLILTLPPGSAKSTYASVLFPPWYLAKRQDSSVIAASHTQDLAERWGRRCRNLIEEHALMLGYKLRADSQAAGRWETSVGGEYYAAGVGGSIAGHRADLILIDDPIRSREDADSKLVRDKQWDWWTGDCVPRLKPGARVVLITTRWHEDDLAGRLLLEEEGKWRVLNIPMEAEGASDPLGRKPGDRLWPEWFTADMVASAKSDPRVWSALYQGRPVPEGGAYFKAEWFQTVEHLPDRKSLKVFGGSDYAVTSDGGDYTVHIVVGVDEDDKLWLLDLWRQQTSSDVWVDAYCDLVKKWKPSAWAEETGQIKGGVGPFLLKRIRERKTFTVRESFPTRGDKAIRAQSIRGRISAVGLRMDRNAPWRADLMAELLRFPVSVHDDQADALGLVGQLLDRMLAPAKPKRPVIKKRDGWDEPASSGVNWQTV